MVDKLELTRRKLLQGSTGAIALALGGGTPFLASRAAYAAASDIAKEQLRTIGLSVTVYAIVEGIPIGEHVMWGN